MSDSEDESPPKKKTRSTSETEDLPPCPYGSDCFRKNPIHFEEFSHPWKDYRPRSGDSEEPAAGPSTETTKGTILPRCPYGSKCYRKNPMHFKEYSHDSSSDSDTDTYYSGDDSNSKPSSLVKKLSDLTPEEQKELLRATVEEKDLLEQQLMNTKSDKTKKVEELKKMLIRMNKDTLMMDGEKEALEAADSGVVYFDLLPERLYNEGSAAQFHMRLAESQFYRLMPRHRASYRVKKVQYVVSPKLVKQFHKCKEEMEKDHADVQTVLAFHGIKETDIQSICEDGFNISAHSDGDYGEGVHFSEYPHSSMSALKGANKLLLCKILPGKIYTCPEEMPTAGLQDGYDSHSSPDGKEFVIFSQERILPCYIVHFAMARTEFGYKNTAVLQRPIATEDRTVAVDKLYRKAQRSRKSHLLGVKHIRLCGKLARDHETIARLIKKHQGIYVDNGPPYCEPGETVPLHKPGSLGFYPLKDEWYEIFNILICSEKKIKARTDKVFEFIDEARDSHEIAEITVVREEWLYDSIIENYCKDESDYAWE